MYLFISDYVIHVTCHISFISSLIFTPLSPLSSQVTLIYIARRFEQCRLFQSSFTLNKFTFDTKLFGANLLIVVDNQSSI